MKKILSLIIVSLAACPVFAQCETTEDANNTVSSCKRSSSAISKEDSRISAETTKQAESRMTDIFNAVIDPSVKKTKGLRGTWNGIINIAADAGSTPYSLYFNMSELGCTKSKKLYEKDESGIILTFRINSLSGIAQACQHKETIVINKSAEEKPVFEKIEGRQMYLLKQPTETEKYAGFAYYRKEKDESKYFVVAKKDVPLFLPVSVKDVLLMKRGNYLARMKYENKAYTDVINQSFESYLVAVDFASFEKNFSKSEAEKAKADYKKSYESGISETKKYLSNNVYQQWINAIDNYIQKTPAARLARPCIICCGYPFGSEPITDAMFLNAPGEGMQYITINPAYINKKNPASIQFVAVETRINSVSAVSLSQKKVFEDSFDFKKLEEMLGK